MRRIASRRRIASLYRKAIEARVVMTIREMLGTSEPYAAQERDDTERPTLRPARTGLLALSAEF